KRPGGNQVARRPRSDRTRPARRYHGAPAPAWWCQVAAQHPGFPVEMLARRSAPQTFAPSVFGLLTAGPARLHHPCVRLRASAAAVCWVKAASGGGGSRRTGQCRAARTSRFAEAESALCPAAFAPASGYLPGRLRTYQIGVVYPPCPSLPHSLVVAVEEPIRQVLHFRPGAVLIRQVSQELEDAASTGLLRLTRLILYFVVARVNQPPSILERDALALQTSAPH